MTTLRKETSEATAELAPQTLVDLLTWRARRQPDEIAYTFLLDGEDREAHLTYGELARRARALAVLIQTDSDGQRVMLLYPPGLDYIVAFFGCLLAGAIPLSMNPAELRSAAMAQALGQLVEDAGVLLVLTNALVFAKTGATRESLPKRLARLRWLLTDELDLSKAHAWAAPPVTAESTAYLQYTSGTTGAPKGVVLTHRNLLHNSAMISDAFGVTAGSVGVLWLPPYHDMGLVGGLVVPLFAGIRVVLLSPVAFLQRPHRWLRAITRYRATFSGGPNFGYDACVRKITGEQRSSLDLSCWKVAFTGAENVRSRTLADFGDAFAASGFRAEAFYPCYGLAEATLLVTGGDRGLGFRARRVQRDFAERHRVVAAPPDASPASGTVTLIGCGRPRGTQKVVIVDPEHRTPCAPDVIGEVWVSGSSVAEGYWGRPHDSVETFGACLATGEGPFLRSGDLGFLDDGQLYITGRLKDLIIVRGRNLYPQDIEQTAASACSETRADLAAVFSVDVDGEERVVVLLGIERRFVRDFGASEHVEKIREAVAFHHGIGLHAVIFVRAENVPKTASGKIRRGECRSRFLSDALDPIGCWLCPS
jgi:acyl-CoA synthetase (AMP-forming)/AMP-acid ligase II